MTDALPLSHSYNFARLGNAGDEVTFSADPTQRAAIARWSGVLSLESLSVTVKIARLGASRFGLDFHLTADVTQACVVTLDPVPAHIDHAFHRELHFTGPTRRKPAAESPAEVVLDAAALEAAEEPPRGDREPALRPRRPCAGGICPLPGALSPPPRSGV